MSNPPLPAAAGGNDASSQPENVHCKRWPRMLLAALYLTQQLMLL